MISLLNNMLFILIKFLNAGKYIPKRKVIGATGETVDPYLLANKSESRLTVTIAKLDILLT